MLHTFFQKAFPFNLQYRNFIFIPVFFAFYLTWKVFGTATFILQDFAGRSISFATSEGLDIGQRVSTYYKAVFFALLLIILFTRLIIIFKKIVNEEELKIANGLSLVGFSLMFFQLIGADMKASIHIIFACLIICLAGFIYHQVRKRENRNFILIFFWSVLLATSLFFFFRQVTLFAGIKNFLSLPVAIVIIGTPIYIWFTAHYVLTKKWIKSTQAFVFLPLLSFLSVELFMIMNQHGVNLSPIVIYSVGLFFILYKSLSQARKKSLSDPSSIELKTLFSHWVPGLLAGIGCLAFYKPIVQPNVDWYESANNVLPLHQWFSFGKFPFLNLYSSHALSDFGTGLLYALFNGPDPMGGFVYGFLIGVLVMIILYFFIWKLTGDGFLALWLVLAYPYVDLLLPSYYNLVPLAALAFVMLYEKQSAVRYTFFFASVLFMPLWRIDLGLSTLIAGFLGILILIFLVPSFKVNKSSLLKGLGINITAITLLFIAALAHSGSQLFVSLKDALGYMSSFQSYGLTALSYSHDMKYFSLYFLMPSVVLLILLYNIFSLIRNQKTDKSEILLRLAIIFLGIFYISNLQRGLVRHTLAEQWDTAFTSFGFFIISALALLKYLNKNPYTRFLMFFIVSTVVVSNYVFGTPDLKTNNIYDSFNTSFKEFTLIKTSKEKIDRTVENPDYLSRYSEFSEWMNKSFSPKSSYIDFSNTPMLYFYSNRELPNYLTQIPQSAHNDYLQERFIEDLKTYDLPVTVFSNVPQTFWDNLDGIPNTIRHYKISEYIYRNYYPEFILNNHCIWVKKKYALKKEKESITVSVGEMIQTEVASATENKLNSSGPNANMTYIFNFPLSLKDKKISFSFNISSNKSGEVSFFYRSSSGTFDDKHKSVFKINEGDNELFIMAEPKDNDEDVSAFRINLPSDIVFSLFPVKVFVTEYYPDLISRLPADYNLKWIPYLWGAYDINYRSGKISVEKNIIQSPKLFEPNQATKIFFAPVTDKENGNYIKITARIPSGNESSLVMAYGDENSRNGAFIFTMKGDTLYHDYLVRISSQFRWYSRNNSWLNLFPVGNSIEIKQAEILKGD